MKILSIVKISKIKINLSWNSLELVSKYFLACLKSDIQNKTKQKTIQNQTLGTVYCKYSWLLWQIVCDVVMIYM